MKAVGPYFVLVASVTHLFPISRLVVLCQYGEIPHGHLRTPLRALPDMIFHDMFSQDLDGNGTIGFDEVRRYITPGYFKTYVLCTV